MTPRDKVTAEPLGKCPCGKGIFVDPEEYAVIHEQPACAQFLELEPDEFLAYVRKSRGIPDPV